MSRLLSWRLPLLVSAAAVLLFAGSASALSFTYDMTGSQMVMVNQICNPCTVAVTGTITLEDDEAGNILLTDVSLAHVPYQVGQPAAVSVVIDRTSISLGAGSVAGTGSTAGGNALFGSTMFDQTGSTTCTAGVFPCALAGLPDGVTPLASPISVGLGTWSFDGLGNITSGSILYTNNAQAVETLTLIGTIVPEPGTALLLAAGLVGMALRRRALA